MNPSEQEIYNLTTRVIELEKVLDLKPGMQGHKNEVDKLDKRIQGFNGVAGSLKNRIESIENNSIPALRKVIWEDLENFKEEIYRYLNATLRKKELEEAKLPTKPKSLWDLIFKKKRP